MTRRSRHLVAAALLLLALAGCGQMGPLYLPGELPDEPAGDDEQSETQDE